MLPCPLRIELRATVACELHGCCRLLQPAVVVLTGSWLSRASLCGSWWPERSNSIWQNSWRSQLFTLAAKHCKRTLLFPPKFLRAAAIHCVGGTCLQATQHVLSADSSLYFPCLIIYHMSLACCLTHIKRQYCVNRGSSWPSSNLACTVYMQQGLKQ